MTIASINPVDNLELEHFEAHTAVEVEAALDRAARAFRTRRTSTTVASRAAALVRTAEILRAEKRPLGELMTREMGKPIAASIAEVEKCASVCGYYAENAASFLAPERVDTDASHSEVRYEPLGVILAVMPWNFPFWQVFRFAAPALVAGNVGILKHASNVPRCALAIEDVLTRAGFADGAFTTLLLESDAVAGLIADSRVAAVTLTGSEGAGIAVGRQAGAYLKKAVLELGGSDPFVVMPSADLERAVQVAVQARTINNGQSCIAAKRFVVHRDITDEFERRFVAGMAALHVGDPMEPETQIGPLATPKGREDLARQVDVSVRAGARLLLGGKSLPGPGNFYEPTVLADPAPGSPAHDDELFGPVATLFRVKDADEAIAVANHPTFGLGAAVWTRDETEIERFITGLEAGSVFVNGMVKSDPRLPFGGIKRSGFGRELARHGMLEFLNAKTVWIA